MKVADDCGDLMTREEFINDCEHGYLINYDGYGAYSDGEYVYDEYISPSAVKSFNDKFTHVMWYNK